MDLEAGICIEPAPCNFRESDIDEQVLRGMARWPNVPAVYGWLALDRRGNWLIRNEVVLSPILREYIGRNYAHDDRGRWFFQNGPQRVFVAPDYTPIVYRVVNPTAAALAIESHIGQPATAICGAWFDDTGAALIESEHGIGLVDDRDLDRLLPFLTDAHANPLPADALEDVMAQLQQGREAPIWLRFGASSIKIEPIRAHEVAQRFRFDAKPVEPPTAAQPKPADAPAR